MRRVLGNVIEADGEVARCLLDLMRPKPMAAAREYQPVPALIGSLNRDRLPTARLCHLIVK